MSAVKKGTPYEKLRLSDRRLERLSRIWPEQRPEETARKSVMWLLGAAAVGALPCFIRMVALAKRIGKVRRSIADKVSRMDSDASDGQDPEEVFYLGDDFSLGRIEESNL